MNWYLKVLKQYADFKGRASRKEFWMFYLIMMVIGYGLYGIGIAMESTILIGAGGLFFLVHIVPNIAVSVRRMHDIGKSGWMVLVSLIPLIGGIWFIVLAATEGNAGSNEYGPDPKNPELAAEDHIVEAE